MRVYSNQPGTSNAVLVTAAQRFVSFSVVAANTSTVTATVRLNVYSAGGAAAVGNRFLPDVPIPGNTVVVFDFPIELAPDDVISGLQVTSGSITLIIDGVPESRAT